MSLGHIVITIADAVRRRVRCRPKTRHKGPVGRRLVDHRALLVAAIDRVEAELDAQRDKFIRGGGCPCCVQAAMGGTDSRFGRLERKLERQRAWLEILDAKIAALGETKPSQGASEGKMRP
jgi:hypothetical protein